jgi:phosphoribosylanthranilate isomerase
MIIETKICGLTSIEDARLAEEAGADWLGVVVEVGYSRRSRTLAEAKAIFEAVSTSTVALLMEPELDFLLRAQEELSPDAFQLVGEDSPDFIAKARGALPEEVALWKSIHLPAEAGMEFDLFALIERAREYEQASADRFVLDTRVTVGGQTAYGGTGQVADWELAAEVVRQVNLSVLLAGGLSPDNVAEAIQKVRPRGVDVASGVENEPGIKSPEKVRAFIQAARGALG